MVGSADVVPLPQITHLTSHNFVTVIPNYRLCPQVSALDGAFADTESCLEWCQTTLQSQLPDSVTVDTDRIVAMGHSGGGTLAMHLAATQPKVIKGIAAFYPSLFVSEPGSTVHKPYGGFAAIPIPADAASAENIASFCPKDKQVSEAPLARPGSKPAARNLWQLKVLAAGAMMEAVMPGGKNLEAIDPVVRFKEVGAQWPPTVFVQGDKDDVSGSGIELVERAVGELKKVGAAKVEVVRVAGEGHVFDLPPMVGTSDLGEKWQAVLKGLDFLRECVGA